MYNKYIMSAVTERTCFVSLITNQAWKGGYYTEFPQIFWNMFQLLSSNMSSWEARSITDPPLVHLAPWSLF